MNKIEKTNGVEQIFAKETDGQSQLDGRSRTSIEVNSTGDEEISPSNGVPIDVTQKVDFRRHGQRRGFFHFAAKKFQQPKKIDENLFRR